MFELQKVEADEQSRIFYVVLHESELYYPYVKEMYGGDPCENWIYKYFSILGSLIYVWFT